MASKHEREDHVVFRLKSRSDGKKGIEVLTPMQVLPVHDADELKAQLRHYAQLLLSRTTVDSIDARRHYMEQIRPALRYFCKKYGVEAPDWLKTDDYYLNTMSVQERHKLFGLKPLRIGEFQKVKPVASGSSHPVGKPEQEEMSDAGDQ